MANPQDFIAGGGSALLNSLFGGHFGGADSYPGGNHPGFFDWAQAPGGTKADAGVNLTSNALKYMTATGGIAPTSAYDQKTGGLSVPTGANPGLLSQMLQDSSQRYFGKGTPGAAGSTPGWQDNWNHWFASNVTGPDGKTLYSPQAVAGGHLNADITGDKGSAAGIVPTLIGAQQIGKAQQPDVTQALQFMRGVDATSPYQIMPGQSYADAMTNQQNRGPNIQSTINDYLPKIGQFAGQQSGQIGSQGWQGAGNVKAAVDPYAAQITGLGNNYEDQLLKDIDSKANINLDDALQGTSAALQAAGLGRSGAGQQALAGELEKIKGQQARDKIAAMADFKNQALNRSTQGLLGAQGLTGQGALQAQNIQSQAGMAGMQLGGQGLMAGMNMSGQQTQDRQQQLAQSLMQGLNNQFQGGQQFRGAEQEMQNQQLQRMMTERMGSEQNLTQALMGAGNLNLQEQLGQAQIQGQGQAELMNQFNQRENYQQVLQQQMMQAAAAEQAQRQSQTTGSVNAMMMPMQLMLNLMGMSGPAMQPQPGFADMLLRGAGSTIGQGVGQAANGYIGNMMFGSQPH